ncbi:peptidoglycan-associated lipoprotein Pal [bacterium]|nr:peptidoglycan-associated lipoprotein Pal [bacterium]RQV96333.1 MAG: peptidoglycan-associated lipoprotein Pal [bacterium]
MKTRTCILVTAFFGLVLYAGCNRQTMKPQDTTQREIVKPAERQPAEQPRQPVVETETRTEPRTTALSFENIHFDFDKYNLKPEAMEILAKHATVLKANPEVKIVIEGHCDERGTIEYNLALGEKRAGAARDYLLRMGIASQRISTISYGKERPLDTNHTAEAWAKNRRAVFVVTR